MRESRNPRGLIFDFDGLIVDSELILAEAVIATLAEHGAEITVADIGHLFGSTEADAEWERLLPTWCAVPITLAELERRVTPDVRARVDRLPVNRGVEELLAEARSTGWRVGLGTGQGRVRLDAQLHGLGLDRAFDATVTAGEVARGKPAPDIFLAVAERLEVKPADCVVLEDSVPGSEAGLAAGMRVIACPSVVTAHCRFPPEVHRVSSLLELRLADLI